MDRFGSFLIPLEMLLTVPTLWEAVGWVALLANLAVVVWIGARIIRPEVSPIPWKRIIACVVGAMCLSVILVWVLGSVSVWAKDKDLRYLSVVGSFLKLVGMAYAETARDLPFQVHVQTYACGVGILEELVKLIVGFGIAAIIAPDVHGPATSVTVLGQRVENPEADWTRRIRSLAFGVLLAGVAFGVGEALLYFRRYSAEGSPYFVYLVRASWCVLLHGSWSVMALLLLSWTLGHLRQSIQAEPNELLAIILAGMRLIICAFPISLLHGLYDACARHEDGFLWLIGGACIVSAGHAFVGLVKGIRPQI